MRSARKSIQALVVATVILGGVSASVSWAAEPSAIQLTEFLRLGPIGYPMPVFNEAVTNGFEVKQLLDASILPDVHVEPRAGETLAWVSQETLTWTAVQAHPKKGLRLESDSRTDTAAVAWLATYVQTDRWQEAKLRIHAEHPVRAWLDGEEVVSDETDEPAEAELKLPAGRHTLLIQTVFDPERDKEWSVRAELVGEGDESLVLAVSDDATRTIEYRDIYDAPTIASVAIDPQGKTLAMSVSRTVPGTAESESWIELRRVDDGKRVESWRGSRAVSQLAWDPTGRYVSYVATHGKGEEATSTLFLYDRREHTVAPLIERQSEFAGYRWSPTGDAIAFSIKVKAEKDERGVKRLRGLMDRVAGYRDKQLLHLVSVPGGMRRQLTAGGLTTSISDFSPDGKRLLFTRTVEDLTARPYSITELWEIDLATLKAKKMRPFSWLGDASYSPDGSRILIRGQATEFDGAGVDLPEGLISNSYEGQLFIWDPAEDTAEPISKGFDPAVDDAIWHADGNIYLRATDRDRVQLYRFDPEVGEFAPLDTGVDVVASFSAARQASMAVVLGSSVWQPQSLITIDLKQKKTQLLSHPADSWLAEVERGSVRDWNFTSSQGATIEGRVYLPPSFDAERKYPCIVYYYGGTVPVNRSFGGRYPKEWWAANGYVVYVPQPSGAIGFGQSFAAEHVNNWGKSTADEIIEGTRGFLAAHSFVDPKRVGCIGASYGGFMTMLLTTRTDLFATAVAHAGISSISSYWGEGNWGYSYSSVASAESFPWNRPDIYVDQSPLFRADKNRVPILLTHGDADTNVPVGESDSFYIALKLLGKEVEYLQIAGQNHWILDHAKRELWAGSILAWFDRWLKQQPDWWNDLYPDGAVAD